MSFDIDLIKKGVIATKWKKSVEAPVDTFLQDTLYGGSPIMGEGPHGIISYNFRRRNTQITDEAIFGQDANRINYKTDFDAKFLKPSYYNDKVIVDWNSVVNRVFQEGLQDPIGTQARMISIIADEKDSLINAHKMNLEKMCADMLLTGKVTVKDGGVQTMPMTSSLLSVSGAKLIAKPVETLLDALTAMRKVNKAAGQLRAIIMNVDDAIYFTQSLGTLINRETFNLGSVTYEPFTANGAIYMGRLIAGGFVDIYAYAGTYTKDGTATNYIPKGKAILLTEASVGSIGYGAVMSADNAYNVGLPVVQAERTTLYATGDGDNKALVIQQQTAPLPITTAIDSYCVLTGIPSAS